MSITGNQGRQPGSKNKTEHVSVKINHVVSVAPSEMKFRHGAIDGSTGTLDIGGVSIILTKKGVDALLKLVTDMKQVMHDTAFDYNIWRKENDGKEIKL